MAGSPHVKDGPARFRAGATRPTSRAPDPDRALGAMLGTFVGDALGMPWEGALPDAVPVRLDMADARMGLGTYTDDTEMTIGVAESLLRCHGVDEADLARTFLALHDPRRGYGAGTTRVLELWRRGVPVQQAAAYLFDGRGSFGNAAAMRVAPIAVRFSDDSALLGTQARRSARVTHAHRVGIDGAAVQAAAVAAAVEGDDPLAAAFAAAQTREVRGALARVRAQAETAFGPEALGGHPGIPAWADASVAAAVVAAVFAESFEQAVTVAIRAGGDTDTVGAMAGAIAGARFGASAIPERWLSALEDGERGRSHVEELGRLLAQHAGAPAVRTR